MMTRRELLIGGAAAIAATSLARSVGANVAVAPPSPPSMSPPLWSPVDAIVGECPAIRHLRESIRALVDRAAADRRPRLVLIVGQTGVGKNQVASVLHGMSQSRGAYVRVVPALIGRARLARVLFGSESRRSAWERAREGTVVIENLELMPTRLWPRFVRALENAKCRRLRTRISEPIDAWTIGTSHHGLDAPVGAGEHTMGELIAPLDPVVLEVPPLRERDDDIQLLADFFLARHSRELKRPILALTPGARRVLASYSWPGNVRHLSNVMEREMVWSSSAYIDREDLAEM